MNRFLPPAAFFVGLAAVCWVATGYVGGHPLALGLTALIAGFYIAGGLELRRYRQETQSLAASLAALREPPAQLDEWLARLPVALRNTVRLRVDGERVGLPGPALTPYLVGLLVLLGMLGTFLGMVVTLNGTGTALASAADVQAIRASLSAPVQGLGLAFGTSIAGVAASAMLGLVSALCRRDRLQVGQALDTCIATVLRAYTPAHRRELSFGLLQRQAQAVPLLVDRIEAMMATLERRGAALDERLVSGQARFHDDARGAYAALASSVGLSLRESLGESARAASAVIQPVVEQTMSGIARETAALRDMVESGVQRQLDNLTGQLATHAAATGKLWQDALSEQRQGARAHADDLHGALGRFSATFEERSAALVDGVASRLESTAERLTEHWRAALALHERSSEAAAAGTQQATAAAGAILAQHATHFADEVERSHTRLQTALAAGDQARLAGWTDAMRTMADSLQQAWERTSLQATEQQRVICDTLAATARDIGTQTEAQARSTLAEVARLVEAAAEAPRAAAEVIGELRQKISEGMARDNLMLDERAKLLESLGRVLDTVNHACTEQRSAIDALVGSSADLLERVGGRFAETLSTEAGKLESVAAQVTGSAAEVASLGEAFGLAVQLFSQSTEKLGAQLQRIEGALSKSTSRSDEQLAYYVAQAREVIDLSIMSQKQIVDDLQQLANRREAVGSAA